jgi:hypothetical protein
MSHTARRRLTGSILAGAIAIALMVLIASYGTSTNPVTPGALADEPSPPELSAAEQAVAVLTRIGVSPTTLAAVGGSAQQATGLVLSAHAYCLGNPDAISQADAALAEARAAQAELTALVQSGQASPEQVSSLGAAHGDVAEAESDLAMALGIARAQILSAITEGQRDAIGLIRDNRAVFGEAMPVAVAADAWTGPEWIESRAALTHVDQALCNGVEPDGDAAEIADDAMNRTAVAAASEGIENNLGDITSAWEAALGGL